MSILARLVAVSLVTLAGCSSSSAAPADAGAEACSPDPVIDCDPSPKGTSTCATDPLDKLEKGLPVDQSFAVGCRALFYTTTCQVRTSCSCALVGTAAKWSCL